jgi:hypothetical protein
LRKLSWLLVKIWKLRKTEVFFLEDSFSKMSQKSRFTYCANQLFWRKLVNNAHKVFDKSSQLYLWYFSPNWKLRNWELLIQKPFNQLQLINEFDNSTFIQILPSKEYIWIIYHIVAYFYIESIFTSIRNFSAA